MPFNSGSIITSRDNLAIDFEKEALLRKIERFAFSRRGDRTVEQEIGYSAKSKWDVERSKAQIRGIEGREGHIRRILYRPFDRRYIYYLPSLLDTPSRPLCESIFDQENLVLLTPGVKTTSDFTHILVSRDPSEKKACSHDRATQMFPLYSYSTSLLGARATNMGAKVVDERRTFSYIYAILHSPTYRSRYGSALRDSYPRVPAPPWGTNGRVFEELARVGRELIELHLIEAPVQRALSARFDHAAKAWGYEIVKGQRLPVTLSFNGPERPVVGRIGWSDEVAWIDAVKLRAPVDSAPLRR